MKWAEDEKHRAATYYVLIVSGLGEITGGAETMAKWRV